MSANTTGQLTTFGEILQRQAEQRKRDEAKASKPRVANKPARAAEISLPPNAFTHLLDAANRRPEDEPAASATTGGLSETEQFARAIVSAGARARGEAPPRFIRDPVKNRDMRRLPVDDPKEFAARMLAVSKKVHGG